MACIWHAGITQVFEQLKHTLPGTRGRCTSDGGKTFFQAINVIKKDTLQVVSLRLPIGKNDPRLSQVLFAAEPKPWAPLEDSFVSSSSIMNPQYAPKQQDPAYSTDPKTYKDSKGAKEGEIISGLQPQSSQKGYGSPVPSCFDRSVVLSFGFPLSSTARVSNAGSGSDSFGPAPGSSARSIAFNFDAGSGAGSGSGSGSGTGSGLSMSSSSRSTLNSSPLIFSAEATAAGSCSVFGAGSQSMSTPGSSALSGAGVLRTLSSPSGGAVSGSSLAITFDSAGTIAGFAAVNGSGSASDNNRSAAVADMESSKDKGDKRPRSPNLNAHSADTADPRPLKKLQTSQGKSS